MLLKGYQDIPILLLSQELVERKVSLYKRHLFSYSFIYYLIYFVSVQFCLNSLGIVLEAEITCYIRSKSDHIYMQIVILQIEPFNVKHFVISSYLMMTLGDNNDKKVRWTKCERAKKTFYFNDCFLGREFYFIFMPVFRKR